MLIREHDVQTDTLTQHVLEAGSGPLVLLIHGFPELSSSWRNQVQALAMAGYRAVAPDMRGYGRTEKPEDRDAYSILHLVGDMVDLVRALGEEKAVIVGHDWGAPVAWHCALSRPDVFRAVVGLSVPFQARNPKSPPTPMMTILSQRSSLGELYMLRFATEDSHHELDAAPETALRKMFWAYDGATSAADRHNGFLPVGQSMTASIADHAVLPPWLTHEHFGEYVAAFTSGGFQAPLNWYRCLDLNWSLTAFLQNRRITQPALFIVGENDPVRHYAGRHEALLADWLVDLRGVHEIKGAGHWLQQERPDQVNGLLIEFLGSL